jgi:hypothetical protein
MYKMISTRVAIVASTEIDNYRVKMLGMIILCKRDPPA